MGTLAMKVIMLDHWGTMSLSDKHGKKHLKTDLPDITQMRIHGDFDNFDKSAISTLNEIITITDCEIVVSSDWKKWCSLDRMKEFYISQDIIKPPIDFTPNLKGKNIFKNRAEEIKLWLNNNKVNKWVSVDDLYLGGYLPNFVWVSRTDQGITQDGIKEQILNILK